MQSLKEFVGRIWLPLFALAAFAAFYIVWITLDLPPQDVVIESARGYFEKCGLLTVFVSAILEGTLMLGWYYPGSLVIVLGVVFAGNDLLQVGKVTIVTTLGFLVAYTFNFYIGKYGWYAVLSALGFREALERAQRQLETYGPRAIFLTYWHPNLAALTSTAAGILKLPFRTVFAYSIVAALVWNTLWAAIGYILGEKAIDAIGPKFVLAFIALWIAIILLRKKKPALLPTDAVSEKEKEN